MLSEHSICDLGSGLAYMALCQHATLRRLRSLKNTSKSELRRQESITLSAVRMVLLHGQVEYLKPYPELIEIAKPYMTRDQMLKVGIDWLKPASNGDGDRPDR